MATHKNNNSQQDLNTDGEGLQVKPMVEQQNYTMFDPENHPQDNALFEMELEKINRQYASVFEKLAE